MQLFVIQFTIKLFHLGFKQGLITRNRDARMNEFPLFSFPLLKIVFISWCNLFINKITIILFNYNMRTYIKPM
jgi:hypothetical protein